MEEALDAGYQLANRQSNIVPVKITAISLK
jgi:hypothetical protein